MCYNVAYMPLLRQKRKEKRQNEYRKAENLMDKTTKKELSLKAIELRKGIIQSVYNAQSGHPGGSLSIAELLTYLYFKEMNIDPANPKDPKRDRMVLSKGHAAPALYAALAVRGYFPMSDVETLRQKESIFQGHPDMKNIAGVDMSTGSLGQGISAACGMALAGKEDGFRVYTVLGDGECGEGQVWEAAMFASHYKLDNLCAMVDLNGLQIDGSTAEVMNSAPLDEKFASFGWNVICIDAHDYDQIEQAFAKARETKGAPTVLICRSVKGKGVSFMENQVNWHGSAPKTEQYEQAMAELEQAYKAVSEG